MEIGLYRSYQPPTQIEIYRTRWRLQVRALNESGTLAACKMPPEIIIKCRPIYRPTLLPETPLKLPLSCVVKPLYFVVNPLCSYRLLSLEVANLTEL